VEVAILDGQGKVVRHLAAGLRGRNSPEPFRKDALAQKILWDRTDDAGKPAAGGPFKVRLRAGLRPRLEKCAGFSGNNFGGFIKGLAEGKDGELFVMLSDPFRGRSAMRLLDSDGVAWPALRFDRGKASGLDAEFLAEQLGLLLELVVLGSRDDAGVDAVGRPVASRYDSVVGQRDDVQDGGLDVLGPSGRHRDVWQGLIGQWYAS
jgi:hypothetical protein